MTIDRSTQIRRGFVDIEEGQAHYRTIGSPSASVLPLVMLHQSPGSSAMLAPLIKACGRRQYVVALDTLGNGDSSAPTVSKPDIPYFASAHLRALSALGIERFDLYGSHTGANISTEMSLIAADRVNAVILDGMSVYTAEEQQDMLLNQAPGVVIDQNGGQLNWVWHFVRDSYLFLPWFRREAANVRDVGLPSADVLHDKVVEVLKAVRTYHFAYHASIRYDKRARLAEVGPRTLMTCSVTDSLFGYFDEMAKLAPRARKAVNPGTGTPEAAEATAKFITDFFAEMK